MLSHPHLIAPVNIIRTPRFTAAVGFRPSQSILESALRAIPSPAVPLAAVPAPGTRAVARSASDGSLGREPQQLESVRGTASICSGVGAVMASSVRIAGAGQLRDIPVDPAAQRPYGDPDDGADHFRWPAFQVVTTSGRGVPRQSAAG